ncbi:MAG: LLM class F420-dependent oxidoreductase [Acidimicrobiales bacterium]
MLFRIFTEPQNGASYDELAAMARTAEETGFDAFFRSDHYLAIEGDGLPGPSDAWVTLAALARDTSRIRLGTLVSPVTFRLPGPLAITVAGVDALSGGRVELGLGTGWYDAEHSAYGIPYPAFGERFERLEEQLEIVTGLWDTPAGQKFSHSGRHYRIENSPALPKPLQEPHPPIIVGGAGPRRTPRLAASYAAEYNVPFFGVEDTKRQYAHLRTACEKQGRDPATLVFSVAVEACCGADEAEAAQRAKATGREIGDLRKSAAAGLPSEVVDRLGAYAEAGAERIYLQVLDIQGTDHVRLLASEVVSHLS